MNISGLNRSQSNVSPSKRLLSGLLLLLLAGGLLLLTFGLRVHNLGAQSLWNDEGSSYVQATRNVADIAANAARDIHPPGYYWLLSGWRLLAGESEFALRAPSAFASLLAAAFLFAIGRRLFGAGEAALAVIFTALNTFSLYYAQEARMYSLLALCIAALFWVLLRLLERPTWRNVVVFGLITAAGLYTQYAFPFFMLAGGLLAVTAAVTPRPPLPATGEVRKRTLLAFTAANLIGLAVYVPWLPNAIRQITTWPNTGVPIAAGEALATISRWLTFGLTGESATMAIPFVLLLFALIGVRRSWQGDARPGSALWPLLVPVLWALVPLTLFLALGLFRPSNLRFLLPAQLGVALWLARGAMVLWHGARDGLLRPGTRGGIVLKLAAAAAVLWLVFTQAQLLPPLYADARYQRADYRAIVARIANELAPGDAVILDAPNQREVFGYYFDRLNTRGAGGAITIYELPPGLGGDDAETRAQLDTIFEAHQGGRAYAVFWGEAERDPNRVVETMLDAQTYPADDTWYGDVRLARYAMRDPAGEPGGGVAFTPPLRFAADEGGVKLERAIVSGSATLPANTFVPGDSIGVRLDWIADETPVQRYSVFVQLLRADGTLALQRDSDPVGGTRPTPTWQQGETIIDHHALLLPRDFPSGEYTLIMGVYPSGDPGTRLRLPDGRDTLELAHIRLQAAGAVNP